MSRPELCNMLSLDILHPPSRVTGYRVNSPSPGEGRGERPMSMSAGSPSTLTESGLSAAMRPRPVPSAEYGEERDPPARPSGLHNASQREAASVPSAVEAGEQGAESGEVRDGGGAAGDGVAEAVAGIAQGAERDASAAEAGGRGAGPGARAFSGAPEHQGDGGVAGGKGENEHARGDGR